MRVKQVNPLKELRYLKHNENDRRRNTCRDMRHPLKNLKERHQWIHLKKNKLKKIIIIKKSTTIIGDKVKDEIHEKILIAVGIAMIIVADEKYSLESSLIPATYMWCAQTKKPTIAILAIAMIIPKFKSIPENINLDNWTEMNPNAGKIIT